MKVHEHSSTSDINREALELHTKRNLKLQLVNSTSSEPRPPPLWIRVITPCCGQCYWVAKELSGAWDKHRARGRKWSLPPNWKTWPQPVAARGWAGWWQYAKISPHGITERKRRAASCSWSGLLSYKLICMWALRGPLKNVPRGRGLVTKKMCRGGQGLCKLVQKVGALSPPHPAPPPSLGFNWLVHRIKLGNG